MKQKLFTLIAFLFALNSAKAQTNADSLTKARAVITIERQLMDGIATGDTALWRKYLAPDFMIVNEDGSRDSKASFLSKLGPLPKGSSGHIVVKDPHLIFAGNSVILHYVADEYETVEGQQLHTTYGEMTVYEQTNNEWHVKGTEVYEIPQLPNAIKVDETTLKQYSGVYWMTANLSYTVSLEDGKLYGQKKGRKKEELLPETYSVFFRMSDTRGRKIFYKEADGKWHMHERRNGQDLIWVKQ